MNIFMLSNGKLPNSKVLLEYALPAIIPCFKEQKVKKVVVIPYAVIRLTYDERVQSVKDALAELEGLEIKGIHEFADPVQAIYDADAIMVSGGNTWYLNKCLHDNGLIEPIRDKVLNQNAVYVGWSAGSVICSPNMCTTNDMCIVDAAITSSLSFLPFHINAHYIDASIENHMGETRDERIAEFCIRNPHKSVIGIPEGTWLYLSDQGLTYHAPNNKPYTWFKFGQEKQSFTEKDMTRFMQVDL